MSQRLLYVVACVCALALGPACGNNPQASGPQTTPDANVGPSDTDAGLGDTGVDCSKDPCGPGCCADNQVCYQNACCTPSCEGKACGSDGCGGTCSGTCDPGWTCNPANGKCECDAETDEAFCARSGVTCGPATGTDNCNQPRTAECDACVAPESCDKATNTCRCNPESDSELCTSLSKNCGQLAATDHCGTARTVNCGTCGTGFLCNAATNVCEVCVNETNAQFCARLHKGCGQVTDVDNCQTQRTVDCGGCQPGFQCDSGTSQCVVCTPQSDADFCLAKNANCGTVVGQDNCSLPRTADCGNCNGSDWCDSHNTCRPCVPESDSQLCANNAIQCGPLTATDSCGNHRSVTSCGNCSNPLEHCDATGACVMCNPESDADLCAFYFKNCGTPTLVDRCGQSRTPSCGTTCTGTLTCQTNGVCGNGVAPTNDTCDTPERLVFDSTGTATSSGDLTNATADYYGSCGGSGKDVVYIVTLTQAQNLTITVGAGSTTIWTEAYIRTSCTSTTDIACGYGSSQGQAVTVTGRSLAPGDYYIIVDGYSGYNGPFTLTVTATGVPPPPTNDTCANPEVLTFVGNTATTTGDTTNAVNDYSDTCSYTTLNGGDLVYKFTLTADSAVTAKVTRTGSSSFYNAVEILDACPSSGTNLACATQSSGVATAAKGMLLAGDYYIIVDGSSSSYGPFTLEVTTTTPIYNDVCSGALDVPLLPVAGSTDLVGVALGDTTGATDDYTSSCNTSATGKDLVYKFTIPAGTVKNIKADLTPQSGSGMEPNLFVRTDCQPNGVEKGCIYSTSTTATVSLQFNRLAEGTYYAFVDAWLTTTNGPFTLTITASEPPPPPVNDTCVRATSLALTNGWAHVTDTTLPATDDYVGGCATSYYPFTGGDMVYVVTTTTTGNIAAKVRRATTSPNYKPAVYIQSTCGDNTTDQGCGYYDYYGLAKASASSVPAGSYYIIVDGVSGTFGDFILDVMTWSGTAPDSCTSAKLLVFDANGDAADVGNSCSLANDSSNNTQGNCTYTSSGYDAAYKLTISTPQNLKVTFDPGHSYYSEIYVQQTTCGSSSNQLACSQTQANTALNTLLMKNLTAGDYYIWLDNDYTSDCGPYNATFHISTPPPAPANDLCTAAQAITIDPSTGVGTVSGTTESATNDTSGSCNTTIGGPDVFYSFTIPITQTVDIQVTPAANSDLKPVLYLQSTCGTTSSENGCKALNATGQVAELQYPRLGAGTYYIVVDSYDINATGPFSLSVTTSTPGPAASNDQCVNAMAMPAIDPATQKTSVTGNSLDGNNDETSTCASSSAVWSGGDLWYTFVLPTDSLVTAKVTRGAGNNVYKAAVGIRRSCAITDEVGCANDSSTSSTGTAQVTTALSAGTWYVFVDGLDGSFGPFTLEITQGSAAIAGDTCGTALPLTFTAGVATYSGNLMTTGLVNDYGATTCASTYSVSPDMVFTFTTTTDNYVTVAMGPQATGGTTLNPFAYIRTSCNDKTTEIACGYTYTNGGSISYTTGRLPAGTYYLFADAYSTSYSGTFTLTVTLVTPVNPTPANDTCRAATPLALTNGTVHVTGDTRDAFDDYGGTGTCGPNNTSVGRLSGGDVVYSVTVSQGSTITASVARDASTTSYVPAVYIKSNCASTAAIDMLACDYATSTTYALAGTTATNLAAGTYYIIVDGKGGTAGLFALDVYVQSTAIANNSCTTAQPILFDTSVPGLATATIVGNTIFGSSNTAGIQQGSQYCYSSGKELYYSFTTTAVQDMFVNVTPLDYAYEPAVYVRSDCTNASAQVVCNYNYGGSLLGIMKLKLPAGSYTLIVDSEYTSYNGPFSAFIKLQDPPPPPSHDTCRGAQSITLPASGAPAMRITDSTLAAFNDYVGACQTSTYTLDGPDLVYSFNLTAATQVKAVVTPKTTTPNYKAAVYIRPSCATVDRDVCKYSTSAGPSYPATVTASLQPGLYYLIVDGQGGTAGDFDMDLSVDDTKYVDGDHCINAKSLDSLFVPGTNPGEMVVTVNDDTLRATNDGDGSCISATGGDFVYSFTVLRDSFVKVDVSRNTSAGASNYTPQFYIRTTCTDTTTQLYCVYTSGSTPQTGSLYHVQPGTYYLFIDSYYTPATYNGPFTATVSVRDTPTAPNNDVCRGASVLNFTSSGGTRSTATLTNEDSTFANNDTGGTCYASTGNDLVYQFSITGSAQSFTATVTAAATSTAYKPVVYIRTVCDQSSDLMEVTCNKTTSGGSSYPVTVTANSLPVGTYYLYVDSYRSSATDPPGGVFNLTAALDAPIAGPSNDSCPYAQAVTLSGPAPSVTTLTGQTTVGAINDTVSTCGATTGPGNDVVYSFTLSDPALVKVKVTPGTGFYPAIYLRKACGSADAGNQLACAYSSSSATAQEASRAYTRPGTYYVWVDAGTSTAANAAGTFQLDVTLATPTAVPPANDVCSGAVTLTLGASPTSGTGANAYLDYPTPGTVWTTVCANYTWKPKAPDLVYTYTPTNSGAFTVSLDATWDSLIWYNTTTCGDASTCGAIRDAGNPEFIPITGVAGTTYYFYVSSYSASVTVGAYTIKVY